jgi:hypothetical protein
LAQGRIWRSGNPPLSVFLCFGQAASFTLLGPQSCGQAARAFFYDFADTDSLNFMLFLKRFGCKNKSAESSLEKLLPLIAHRDATGQF